MTADSSPSKRCKRCGVVQSLDRFYTTRRGSKRYHLSTCKSCDNEQCRERRNERFRGDPEAKKLYQRRRTYRHHYGIELETFERLVEEQGGCAICGSMDQMRMDHDHSCCPEYVTCGNCLRGALCHACNVAIGLMGESVERLEATIEYLKRPHLNLPRCEPIPFQGPKIADDVMDEIIRMRDEGLNYAEIARELQRREIPTAQGKSGWLDATVRQAYRRVVNDDTSHCSMGEGNSQAKLTAEQVAEIREAHTNGVPQKHLVEVYGVGQATISNIVRRRTWSHV